MRKRLKLSRWAVACVVGGVIAACQPWTIVRARDNDVNFSLTDVPGRWF